MSRIHAKQLTAHGCHVMARQDIQRGKHHQRHANKHKPNQHRTHILGLTHAMSQHQLNHRQIIRISQLHVHA
ncbi:hypothetical protein [Moraxella lacunata]|uniref:hypothetical protein n=1 Tax=Moraxella lacunata TaxID=477 RepID=UPI003EE2064A